MEYIITYDWEKELTEEQFEELRIIAEETDELHRQWDQEDGLEWKETTKKDIRESLKEHNGFIVIALMEDYPVGYCVAGSISPFFKETAWIDDIAVEELLRGFGIGKELMKIAIRECHKNGIKNILLKVDSKNNTALNLYSELGFNEWGKTMLLNIPDTDIKQGSLKKTSVIVKVKDGWQVQSEKGRNMGTYKTKKEADERLRQIEYFKYKNK